MQPDALLRFAAAHRVRLARQLGRELLTRGEQREPLVVERRGDRKTRRPEGVALVVRGGRRQPRLSGAQRQLLSLPWDPRLKQRVLQSILPLGEVANEDPVLARQSQTREALALVRAGCLLRLA